MEAENVKTRRESVWSKHRSIPTPPWFASMGEILACGFTYHSVEHFLRPPPPNLCLKQTVVCPDAWFPDMDIYWYLLGFVLQFYTGKKKKTCLKFDFIKE